MIRAAPPVSSAQPPRQPQGRQKQDYARSDIGKGCPHQWNLVEERSLLPALIRRVEDRPDHVPRDVEQQAPGRFAKFDRRRGRRADIAELVSETQGIVFSKSVE